MATAIPTERLEQKHQALENLIQAEQTRPRPDTAKLTGWKLQKLRLKEQMVLAADRLRHAPTAAGMTQAAE